jgi:transcriptional regulator with XRE-family HTH domain
MDNKELIYINKSIIGVNILELIKKEGYTKASFSKRTGISRPTLNKILDGDIPSSTTLETHIAKILDVLNIDMNNLLNYKPINKLDESLDVAYYDNAPQDNKRSESAIESLNLLDNILDLCEIYYK